MIHSAGSPALPRGVNPTSKIRELGRSPPRLSVSQYSGEGARELNPRAKLENCDAPAESRSRGACPASHSAVKEREHRGKCLYSGHGARVQPDLNMPNPRVGVGTQRRCQLLS
jgi:hypothetical protein